MIAKMEHIRILVADDEPEGIWPLIKYLENEYDVICATSGEQILEVVRSPQKPDMILLDSMMPGMDGYEVFSRLKTDPETSNIPVIFLTAKNEEMAEAKALELGAQDYISKPFSLPVVRARIKSVLNLQKELDRRQSLKKQLEDQNAQLEDQVQQKVDELQRARESLRLSENKYHSLFREQQEDKHNKRLLLVDDHPENLHVLIHNLQDKYEIICANNGESALKCALAAYPPDLILLDIMMPDMDGFEVCSHLKANPATWDIPIIFVTALGQEVDEAKGLDFGAVDFITKPFSITIVQARIKAALRLKEEMDQRIMLTRKLEGLNTELENRVQEKSTALRQAHEDLQASENKYRSICENAPEGVFQTSFEGRFLSANPAMARILGYSSVEDLLQNVNDIKQQIYVYPEERDILLALLGEPDRAAIVGHELQLYRKDKQIIWVSISIRVVRDDVGNPLFLEGFFADITVRKRAEAKICEMNERFMSVLRAATAYSIIGTDLDGIIKIFNVGAELMLGYRADEVVDKAIVEIIHDSDEVADYAAEIGIAPGVEVFRAAARQGKTETREWTYIRKDKSRLTVSLTVTAMRNEAGVLTGFIGIARDITTERKLEQQLIQSQKMESVGLLAGGIAHDFNNLLTPILGYTELLIEAISEEDPHREMLRKVHHAADSAKDLTRHLLAFSRKQVIELKTVNLGAIILRFERMMHRMIRENITFEIKISPSLGLVSADAGQIEQVLLNLSINAQDAMPEGGTLGIEVKDIDLDESYTSGHRELVPGQYVMLSVSDTGMGMDEEVMAHVFEPFFTTKDVGKGTGLGLSTVYGIVKQHGGSISVSTEKEQGSIFKIFIPRVSEEETDRTSQASSSDGVVCGAETVLLAEDNELVRILTCRMLDRLGYRVIAAETVERCVELMAEIQEPIDLLLTDVIMPTMNGRELFDLLRLSRPDLKVLFMSGYTSDVIGHHGVLDHGTHFIHKPFSLHELSEKVRQAMDT